MKQQAMGMKLAILRLHWDPSNLDEQTWPLRPGASCVLAEKPRTQLRPTAVVDAIISQWGNGFETNQGVGGAADLGDGFRSKDGSLGCIERTKAGSTPPPEQSAS